MVCRMDRMQGFVETGLATAGRALQAAGDRAGLHLAPDTLTRTAARRLRSSLRAIETLVRRLLVLIAASLELEDRKGPASPARDSQSPARLPGRRARVFELMPPATFDPEAFQRMAATPAQAQHRNYTGIRLLLDRFHTLRAVIEDPARAARRMARLLAREKEAGALKPICMPQERLYRFDAEFGLIAAALPGLVSEVLPAWYDTG